MMSFQIWRGQRRVIDLDYFFAKKGRDPVLQKMYIESRNDFLTLKERYTYDLEMKANIIADWIKYGDALRRLESSDNITEQGDLNIIISEIHNRYQKLLVIDTTLKSNHKT